MWTRRTFAGLGALAAASPAIAQQASSALSLRRGEIETLRRFAETTHPCGLEAAGDARWRGLWDALASEADGLSDGAYFVRTRRALGWFEDGHTTVLPFEFVGGVPAALQAGPFALSLPIRVRVFHDGAFVTDAKDEAAPLLGARITQIGAQSTVELLRRHAQGWPGSASWAHRWGGAMFASPALLQGLGALSDPSAPVTVRAVTAHGGAISVRLRPRPDADANRVAIERPLCEREQWAATAQRSNYVHALPERQALYLSVDEMGDVSGATFSQFTREAFAAMEALDLRRLAIDLRRNGGGDNFLGEALRKHIERSSFNRTGGLYVLIAPQTFSAAQNLANRLERETFAIFVGDPSGGKPNHYGDGSVHVGQATGMTYLVSTIPWFDSYPMDHRLWIAPDLALPAMFADWRAGRDPALELALTHTPGATEDELTSDRVFFFARASQQVEWKPFWRA